MFQGCYEGFLEVSITILRHGKAQKLGCFSLLGLEMESLKGKAWLLVN